MAALPRRRARWRGYATRLAHCPGSPVRWGSGSVRPVAGAAGPKLGGSRAEPVAGRVSGRQWPQFLQESTVDQRAGQHSVIGPETRLVETVSAGLDQVNLLSGYG